MDPFVYDSEEFRAELRGRPHEAGEVAFLRSIVRPGMRALDAGANRGVTAVALSRQVGPTGHVHAFEPVPEFYDGLNENLARNGAANVTAHMLALSDRTGPIRFHKHGGASGITAAEGAEEIRVQATALADFFAERAGERIDLLNLDCEGSELLVLRGAAAVLKTQAPRVFCEIHDGYLKDLGQSVHDVAGFLTRAGYDVRGLRVEDLGAETALEACSHLYAAPPGAGNDQTEAT